MRTLALAVLILIVSVVQAGKLPAKKPNDLYGPNDKMLLLTSDTFGPIVFDSTKVHLIEFYNSWCGFCQRFAPTWKSVASSVYSWRDIVRIGAVDCANSDNNPLCRDLEIMSYPTLRVFHPKSKKGDAGLELETDKTVASIVSSLLENMEKEQLEGRGSPGWPNLIPYRNSELKNIWMQVPNAVQHTFLIFEEASSFMGKEVILDFHHVRNIQIRRITANNEAVAKLIEIQNYPSLAVLMRDMSVVHLMPTSKSRESYAAAIHAYLSQQGVIEDVEAFRDIPREPQSYYGRAEKQNNGQPQNFPDVVYRVDLENTLRFSLKHEIAMHRVIQGETLNALRDYLRILAAFFPAKPQGTMFLERLRDWAISTGNSIRGEDFLLKVNQLEKTLNYVIPEDQDWVGCRGSSSSYRGYTCGLWTLFHTLTVGAATQTRRRPTPGSDQVLRTMLQYVRFFFGCAGCSKHFQEMAAERGLVQVKGLDEPVLWLWEAHNVVNKRLKGDLTEDPAHPKQQFPVEALCASCKAEGEEWDKDEVLSFLKQRYNKANICQHDIQNVRLCEPVRDNQVVSEKLVDESVSTSSGTSDFNYADIFLCFLLYLVSASVLILVYYKFVINRGHKKKYNMN